MIPSVTQETQKKQIRKKSTQKLQNVGGRHGALHLNVVPNVVGNDKTLPSVYSPSIADQSSLLDEIRHSPEGRHILHSPRTPRSGKPVDGTDESKFDAQNDGLYRRDSVAVGSSPEVTDGRPSRR